MTNKTPVYVQPAKVERSCNIVGSGCGQLKDVLSALSLHLLSIMGATVYHFKVADSCWLTCFAAG